MEHLQELKMAARQHVADKQLDISTSKKTRATSFSGLSKSIGTRNHFSSSPINAAHQSSFFYLPGEIRNMIYEDLTRLWNPEKGWKKWRHAVAFAKTSPLIQHEFIRKYVTAVAKVKMNLPEFNKFLKLLDKSDAPWFEEIERAGLTFSIRYVPEEDLHDPTEVLPMLQILRKRPALKFRFSDPFWKDEAKEFDGFVRSILCDPKWDADKILHVASIKIRSPGCSIDLYGRPSHLGSWDWLVRFKEEELLKSPQYTPYVDESAPRSQTLRRMSKWSVSDLGLYNSWTFPVNVLKWDSQRRSSHVSHDSILYQTIPGDEIYL